MPAAKVIAVVIAALAGALAAVGCLLAGLFELQGFGRPRDSDPRAAYLSLLVFGVLAGALVPLGLWRLLLPDTAPAAGRLGVAASAIVALAVLGIVIAR